MKNKQLAIVSAIVGTLLLALVYWQIGYETRPMLWLHQLISNLMLLIFCIPIYLKEDEEPIEKINKKWHKKVK